MQITTIDQRSTVYKLRTLTLDGVYAENKHGKYSFNRIKALATEELAVLVHIISHRVANFLERKGMLVQDDVNSYLQGVGI